MYKRFGASYTMNSPQGLAKSEEVVKVVELRWIAATPFKHAKPLAVRVVKRFVMDPHRGDH
jgi:ribosomal protein L31E